MVSFSILLTSTSHRRWRLGQGWLWCGDDTGEVKDALRFPPVQTDSLRKITVQNSIWYLHLNHSTDDHTRPWTQRPIEFNCLGWDSLVFKSLIVESKRNERAVPCLQMISCTNYSCSSGSSGLRALKHNMRVIILFSRGY